MITKKGGEGGGGGEEGKEGGGGKELDTKRTKRDFWERRRGEGKGGYNFLRRREEGKKRFFCTMAPLPNQYRQCEFSDGLL